MNNVCLSGRLTKDPEVRYTSSQMAIASFTLAVDRQFSKDKEKTADFIRITAFGKTGEFVERYLTKGRLIGVTGRIQTGSYQTQQGETRYTTDVIAENIEFLGPKGEGGGERVSREAAAPRTFGENSPEASAPSAVPGGFTAMSEEEADDIPF